MYLRRKYSKKMAHSGKRSITFLSTFFSGHYMKERHLVVISIIVLVLGMGFLVLYAEEADLVPLARLEENQVEQYVRVTGTIEQLRAQDKVWFLQVMGERTEMVNIIFFPEEDIFLEEGNMVEIEGVVEEYEGKKEVVAHSIVIK